LTSEWRRGLSQGMGANLWY